jgi:hypothetical protein
VKAVSWNTQITVRHRGGGVCIVEPDLDGSTRRDTLCERSLSSCELHHTFHMSHVMQREVYWLVLTVAIAVKRQVSRQSAIAKWLVRHKRVCASLVLIAGDYGLISICITTVLVAGIAVISKYP